MARDINQKMRFTDAELSLMKGLFANNEELLYIIRKALLQFTLTEPEEISLRKSINKEMLGILNKVFLPTLDPESPVFQMTDMVLGLGPDIREKSPEDAIPYILAKEIEISYLAQQLDFLENMDNETPIYLEDMANLKVTKTNKEKVWANIMARNFLLSFIDTHIQQIKFLAGLKEETVEETKARLLKDSSK
jgi:hypothetical protein